MPGGNGEKPERIEEQLIPVKLSILKADPRVIYLGRIIGKGKIGPAGAEEEFDLLLVETNPPSFMVKVAGDRYLLSSLALMKAVSVIRKDPLSRLGLLLPGEETGKRKEESGNDEREGKETT